MRDGIVELKKVLAKENPTLSIFTTAGFPKLKDTVEICIALEDAGADLIEIGIPFSDPIADGEMIQRSSDVALSQGMNLEKIFEQVREIRQTAQIPILLMGYFNPILQYGVDRFLDKCKDVGVDGLIIPDLPREEFLKNWQQKLKTLSLSLVFLITPQTSESRIREMDELSSSFIYAVSSHGVTGGSLNHASQETYYKDLRDLKLKHPILIGFGIREKESFDLAAKYVKGAIIGSEFLRQIEKAQDVRAAVSRFISTFVNLTVKMGP